MTTQEFINNIKTYEDVIPYLDRQENIEHDRKNIVALKKLEGLIRVANDFRVPNTEETVYFPCLREYSQTYIDMYINEENKAKLLPYKGVPMLRGYASHVSLAGLGFMSSYDGPAYASAFLGAVLACFSAEVAEYIATQFVDLMIDYLEYPEK